MGEAVWRDDEDRFDRLALALFAHQFRHCSPYARFCEKRGRTPAEVRDWREIPAVPAGAFKEMPLRSFPEERTIKTFRTSGTSGGRSGELHLDTLELYEASLMASLREFFLSDLLLAAPSGADESPGHAHARPAIRVLAPSDVESPDSSLSHMFGVLLRELGSPASGFDVVGGALRVEALVEAIGAIGRAGEPLALCGTAFAFVHLLDALGARGGELPLPEGSRLMETGGFKGKSREMPRDELYEELAARLRVPRDRIVNQYGMTELGSQFYDSVLRHPGEPRRKLGPPWVRVRLIDPATGEAARPGEPGIIRIHDLANTGSLAAIETADLGRRVLGPAGEELGFEVLGREPGAEARGCSIALDDMLGRRAGSEG